MSEVVQRRAQPTAETASAAAAGSAVLSDDAALRRLLGALRAVRDGDFRVHLDAAGEGLLGEIAAVFNDVVERNRHLSLELGRVSRVVGREGRLDERLRPGIGEGAWAAAIDAANDLVDDLARPTVEVGQVLAAVADGNLSRRIETRSAGRPLRGEFLRVAKTANGLVDQLAQFSSEVTRVAREVGTEGKLGGQARVRGVAGSWRDLTDSVNSMAANLTAQVRDIAQVTTAVARGDLSRKVTVEVAGEMLQLKGTVNTMVDQLSGFASEVTRVAREVGTEGRLGGQAQVPGVAGSWKDLTDSVNSMAANLTAQVRDIAQVTTAVAKGDLSQKITVEVAGEMLQLKATVNTMVDQLSAFADEVTRVAREVGTDGRLGGQADVKGVSGTWKDLTESVNVMANNLTGQVRNIAQVTTAVARGDLSQKITEDARGEIMELKNTINTMVDQLSAFADEVTRVAREVGTEGDLGGQAQVRGVSGTWKDLTDNVNFMARNLTNQVRSIAQVATAVARGDLSQKITVEAKGEVAALAQTINTMVDTLSAFGDEVTRVAREVGTEGILGGQARVPNVAGTWKDLTDNVNSMANNLTSQVRNIALVTTSVARGDLSKKIDVDARGEILELKTTINTMVDQLSAFASEVTRVAREVGSEGRLGGQAEVEGVSGTWKRLTESVNQLAGNLTTQVRAITEVATAVTRGDLTRRITVDASGEVADLKDNINRMIFNLRETTRANEEQDWLKTNLARISGLMQGRRDLLEVAQLIMNELAPAVSALHGAFFLAEANGTDRTRLRQIAGYGIAADDRTFRVGETLVGQAALERTRILVRSSPPEYIRISSGLGDARPASVVIVPVLFEEQVLAVIELASFSTFTDVHLDFLDQLVDTTGVIVNTIIANSRTESLLAESQRQNRAIEVKNVEIEQARRALEDRAEQLALSSQYKSEFLANMSHELRTPLNSLLVLARLLADNPSGNLTDKQVEFAGVIHEAGSDLLQLIDDILDLSKVEAGKMDVHRTDVPLSELTEYVEATFRPLTVEKGLHLAVTLANGVPETVFTDEQRLQQILRNLLSNAVKFTNSGEVRLTISPADPSVLRSETLRRAGRVLAFEVRDTGIGIPEDKLPLIFEAFQQADGTTSRRYGGTGLGLSICREIARLLGGEIQATSRVGEGSTFTYFLPAAPVAVTPEPSDVYGPATGSAGWVSVSQMEGTARAAGPVRAVGAGPVDGGPAAEADPAAGPVEPVTVPRPDRRSVDSWLADHPNGGRVDDAALAGRRVLVVDDDVRNVFALTAVLEQYGMVVRYAENGEDAIAALDDDPATDLILMDIMMPGMDGNSTTRAIHARPEYAGLPIIALTAKAMLGDREKSLAAGASDYVTKPVDVEHLLRVISTWLARADRARAAAAAGAAGPAAAGDPGLPAAADLGGPAAADRPTDGALA
jgi:signal transduction histidine kinase/HAMP domain-containing protein/AmiR/NasT family two-component response regulator